MRLLTHNYLQSNVKGTTKGYPLFIEADQVSIENTPMDRETLTKFIQKIDYNTLKEATKALGGKCEIPELPETLPDEIDDNLAKNIHHVLFNIHILEGFLICPDTGRKFTIKQGIPNMILHEDEL